MMYVYWTGGKRRAGALAIEPETQEEADALDAAVAAVVALGGLNIRVKSPPRSNLDNDDVDDAGG